MIAKFINEKQIEKWQPHPHKNYIEYVLNDIKMICSNPTNEFLKMYCGYLELAEAVPPRITDKQRLEKTYKLDDEYIIETYKIINVGE